MIHFDLEMLATWHEVLLLSTNTRSGLYNKQIVKKKENHSHHIMTLLRVSFPGVSSFITQGVRLLHTPLVPHADS